jgi:hypothetical protein
MEASVSLLTARTICMQMFEIKRLLKSNEKFSDSLTDSVKKFVLYNNLNRHHLSVYKNSGNIILETLADFGLVIDFAQERFPKLDTFELSLHGFSLEKFINLLETKTEIGLNVDMWDTPDERNYLSTDEVTFFFKSSKG